MIQQVSQRFTLPLPEPLGKLETADLFNRFRWYVSPYRTKDMPRYWADNNID